MAATAGKVQIRRFGYHRPFVALLALAWLLTGLLGGYSYWESYYQHRGFQTVAMVPHSHQGRLRDVPFYSPALHRQADYYVFLPPGYDPTHRRYPVYYLLHGSPGRPQVYIAIANINIRLDNLIAEHRIRPMILVFPDGRIGGSTYSDSEWANTPAGNYESYVLEVVRQVDQHFAALPKRQDRVIAGFSAGAYGATNIALHNLSVFGNLQSWSGYYSETRSGVFAHASPAQLTANSPMDYVAGLRDELTVDPLRAFLFVGRGDEVSPQTQPMANALAAAGARVSYAIYHGGHDWELWHAHLNQMLILASRYISAPLRAQRAITSARRLAYVPPSHHLGLRSRPARAGLAHRPRVAHTRRAVTARRSRVAHPRRAGGVRRARIGRHGRHQARALGATARPPLGRSNLHPAALTAIPPGKTSHRRAAAGQAHRRRGARGALGNAELIGGLLLALLSAALINLGFLLQHRGLRGEDGFATGILDAFRNRTWLAGQALGWTGFGIQIFAVAIAPLSLVQAFAAGGLALSVPLSAGVFGHRISRSQLVAVLLIAGSLAMLPIAFSSARDSLHPGFMVQAAVIALAFALALGDARSAALKAAAAGISYGVADAAIKAVSIGWRAHGGGAILSGWTALAIVATFGGFLAFQAALRGDGAIAAISLMNALAALVALGCGVLAFGESLGSSPAAVVAHLVAIAVLLGCVPVLAVAQTQIAQAGEARANPLTPGRPSLAVGQRTGP